MGKIFRQGAIWTTEPLLAAVAVRGLEIFAVLDGGSGIALQVAF